MANTNSFKWSLATDFTDKHPMNLLGMIRRYPCDPWQMFFIGATSAG
jgi:hypothetical protein